MGVVSGFCPFHGMESKLSFFISVCVHHFWGALVIYEQMTNILRIFKVSAGGLEKCLHQEKRLTHAPSFSTIKMTSQYASGGRP